MIKSKITRPLACICLFISALGASDIKLKMLFLETPGCQWCKKMDGEIFKNEERMDDLEDMYEIFILQRGAKEIPKFIKPRYYPTTYILSSDSKTLIDELPGYIKPEHFMEYVKELYDMEADEAKNTSSAEQNTNKNETSD